MSREVLNSLAQSHEALFDDVSLGLGEGSSSRQPVDGVQHGVDHYSSVVAAGEERGALGDERQHGGTQVAVQRQGHLRGAERSLLDRVRRDGCKSARRFSSTRIVNSLYVCK